MNNERLAAPAASAFAFDLHPDGERFAAVISAQSPDANLDKVVFVLDSSTTCARSRR